MGATAIEPLPSPTRLYDQSFARWVYRNVKGGDTLALCMQCGTCAGSCHEGRKYDNGPRKLFQMIRAGMVENVMTSREIHACGRCFLCVARCPRGVPVAHILKDLGRRALELGFTQKPSAHGHECMPTRSTETKAIDSAEPSQTRT